MYTEFYKDRPLIQNEYEEADWNTASGLEPHVIDRMIRDFAAANPKMPAPLVMAHAYRLLLENAQLSLNPHTMFPDKLRHGGEYKTVATQSVLEMYSRERYENALMRGCPAIRSERNVLRFSGVAVPDTDVWHTVVDWSEVLRLGAPGLLQRAKDAKREKQAAGTLTERQSVFYDSVIISFTAMLTYMRRLLAEAEHVGCTRYAAALTNLLAAPPKTLYEVLCLSHIMLNVEELGRERCRSYGAIDELYMPYFVADLESGRETEESVKEMFRYFWQKVTAEKRYADQPICIGKAWTSDDCPAARLTVLMLDAYKELDIHNPKIHIRCSKNMSDKLLGKLCGMIRDGNSSVVLLNDETVLTGYERLGIPREIAKDYIPTGCYEPVIPGLEDARICASWINLAKACEYAVTGGRDLLTHLYVGMHTEEPKAWDAFLDTYYAYLAEHCAMVINNVNEQAKFAYAANPSPYYSGTIASCIESGRDVFDGGMTYRNQSLKCFAIATAVDSLLAVKKFVYERRRVTLAELRTILENNWAGAETLRAEILHDPVKYGNHLAEADDLTHDIYDFCAAQIVGKPTSTGGVFRLGCDSVNMVSGYGMRTGASADGRLAREELSKNMRPTNGMEKHGVTAFIQSVCAIDNCNFTDGAPLDFIVHPSAVEGDAGLAAMKALIRTFFTGGGFAIQGNVLSLDTLRDAQEHPEKYPNLQVRVCGWNEYFVNMRREVQDDFIRRSAGIETA